MIENEQEEVEWAQAARKIVQRARRMAEARHVTLIDTKWHRGHEVADLDDWWLTLTSDKRAVTARFRNDWLDARGAADNDQLVKTSLSGMLRELMRSREQ